MNEYSGYIYIIMQDLMKMKKENIEGQDLLVCYNKLNNNI